MKKLTALLGVLALVACGGDDADTAIIEDTTDPVVAPAAEPAPVIETDATVDTTLVDTGMVVESPEAETTTP